MEKSLLVELRWLLTDIKSYLVHLDLLDHIGNLLIELSSKQIILSFLSLFQE